MEASYSLLPAVDGCGGNFQDVDSWIFNSPHYPNPYPHNLQCVWTAAMPDGEVLTFNVTDLDLEPHRNCMYDYLEVSKENSSNSIQFS